MPQARIEVYTQLTNPIYAGIPFQVKVGYYDPTGALIDITAQTAALSWEILNGEGVVIWQEPGQIKPLTSDSYRIRFTYTFVTSVFVTDYSFFALPVEPTGLTQQQAYNCLKREEPADVYSQDTDPHTSLSYVDNWSFCNLIGPATPPNNVPNLYDYLQQQTNNIYPELALDPTYIQQWEQTLTGQYGLYDPTSTQTPDILRFIRNNGFTFNPYDLAFWISEYIYLKLNTMVYVYIEETLVPYNTHYWILGASQLGVNTYLSGAFPPGNRKTVTIHVLNYAFVIDDKTKAEILFLLGIWGMCGITYDIDYGHHPSDFGLIQNLGNTYKGDPRTIGIYCIQYDPTAVRYADGLTDPFAPSKLIGIQISPDSGNYQVTNVIPFTVEATYQYGYSQDITGLCQYDLLTPATMRQQVPANIFECIDTGVGEVTATYWYLSSPASITITPYVTSHWIINVSQLGFDTTLGS